jgi:hypothetical protein
MGQNHRGNSTSIGAILAIAAAGMALFAWPALAQHASGHAAAGHMGAARSMSSGRSTGTPMRGGQRTSAIRPHSFGASSAPRPSWELPRTVTPHWEIPSSSHMHRNPVQGNRIPRRRGGFGVGYVGLPYYIDPLAFADGDTDDNAEDQAQPSGPDGPDYAQQGPYAEGPPGPYEAAPGTNEDQGYPPPPRAPYSPEAYQQQPQTSAAAQSDGLDHPAVTLVFHDGRPPMQVHSYVLTGSSVFVAEHGRQQVIPVADLDLPATIAQNRNAGVDFQLPGCSR